MPREPTESEILLRVLELADQLDRSLNPQVKELACEMRSKALNLLQRSRDLNRCKSGVN